MHLLGLGFTSLHSDWLWSFVMASVVKRSFPSETSKKHNSAHLVSFFTSLMICMYRLSYKITKS